MPALGADMTEEDAASAAAQLAHELRRAKESRAAKPNPRREKPARAAEERARRHEQLRKDSVGGVYRRLAKELHPDLERDPAGTRSGGKRSLDGGAADIGSKTRGGVEIHGGDLSPHAYGRFSTTICNPGTPWRSR